MSHTLTESPTFAPTVTVPDDGDDLEAASVEVGFQALANRTQAIKAGTVDLDNATVVGDLEVGANAEITGTLAVDDQSTFNGQAFFNANVTFNQNVAFNDPASFNDLVTIGGAIVDTLTVSSSATINNLVVSGYVVAAMRFLNAGRIRWRVLAGVNSDTSYGPARISVADRAADFVVASTISATRVYTISDENASDGDFIVFANTTANTLQINRPAGTLLISLISGGPTWALCIRIGGQWVALPGG